MQKYYGWGLPIDISTHGAPIDHLIYVFHIFMGALFAGWMIFMIIALIRFRARPGHSATYKIHHFKAPAYVEIGVAVFEFVLLFAVALPVFNMYRNVFPPEDKSLVVRVVAEQFAWNIHYPGADGKFGKTSPNLVTSSNLIGLDRSDPNAKDDIVTVNQLHIPVNKPVIAKLYSKDVIHSFSLPVMRVKQDVIPGQEIKVSFQAKQTGKFEIACAQLCGLGHYRMRGFFVVETPEDFEKWKTEQLAS